MHLPRRGARLDALPPYNCANSEHIVLQRWIRGVQGGLQLDNREYLEVRGCRATQSDGNCVFVPYNQWFRS